jgi:hypothetical protein
MADSQSKSQTSNSSQSTNICDYATSSCVDTSLRAIRFPNNVSADKFFPVAKAFWEFFIDATIQGYSYDFVLAAKQLKCTVKDAVRGYNDII